MSCKTDQSVETNGQLFPPYGRSAGCFVDLCGSSCPASRVRVRVRVWVRVRVRVRVRFSSMGEGDDEG